MRSLQRKLWTHRKWSGWLNRMAPSSESAQLVSMWPWSGHLAPEAKTVLRSETKLLLTKEPKQEVRFWCQLNCSHRHWLCFQSLLALLPIILTFQRLCTTNSFCTPPEKGKMQDTNLSCVEEEDNTRERHKLLTFKMQSRIMLSMFVPGYTDKSV